MKEEHALYPSSKRTGRERRAKMSFLDNFWQRSGGNSSRSCWQLGGSLASQTASEEAAPRKARLSRAKLHISGGVKYKKTHATQLSGISPNPGPPFAAPFSVKLDNDAHIASFLLPSFFFLSRGTSRFFWDGGRGVVKS